jgi:hypothetical protein
MTTHAKTPNGGFVIAKTNSGSESAALGDRNRGKAKPARSREDRVGRVIQIDTLHDRLLWHRYSRRCAECLSERKGGSHSPRNFAVGPAGAK